MNFLYGGLALVASFAIAKFFSDPTRSKAHNFILAFVLEFIAISALGALFYFLNLGFFGDGLSDKELLTKVLGFSLFLSVLVAMKAVNQAEKARIEQEGER